MGERAAKHILIGYEDIGYRLAVLDSRGRLTGAVVISRDVIFDERGVCGAAEPTSESQPSASASHAEDDINIFCPSF